MSELPQIDPTPPVGDPYEGAARAVALAPEATLALRLETRSSRVGVALMVVSMLFWLPIPVLPLLPLETSTTLFVAGAMLVAAEVTFWGGALLAGPEAVRWFKRWLRHRVLLRPRDTRSR